MDRDFFAHSRMLIVYADGSAAGECSINCAAIEMKQGAGRQITSIMVGDYNTKKLIDAKKAIWVVGGRKSGVMTSEPKWAFAGKDAAEKFVKEYGGRIATFDEALDLALKEND
jgi:nitrous oxide reductase accessory protein NosL